MSEKTDSKAMRDLQRSLEDGYLIARMSPRDRNEFFMFVRRGVEIDGYAPAGLIADEYARLARLANRIYRWGQKAGPK